MVTEGVSVLYVHETFYGYCIMLSERIRSLQGHCRKQCFIQRSATQLFGRVLALPIPRSLLLLVTPCLLPDRLPAQPLLVPSRVLFISLCRFVFY